ncbi:coenzyme F420-0:L-glutamate ligase [Nocardioides faecalis]|uniref:coenzyme F420-0:L-glutamate ligase n=1 Tax=Nocardioides faecalis TaxID=2803858 RepID=UPI0020C15ECB|nr:coenzyme F420-0:L-glutamate ligase [Nocardioides faecalis]
MSRSEELRVLAPGGLGEVRAGDDLAALLLAVLHPDHHPDDGDVADAAAGLRDGDIVVVTSKVVSKAEGRVVAGERERWIDAETQRVVATRGATRIVRNRLGLTMAAAGVDASNVAAGSLVLLPEDPDASARALRTAIAERTGLNVGVIVTDTAGRAWREGQTDIAIGAAGILVLESFAGVLDAHGNELAVTAPAVADQIASAVELAQGKLGGRPCGVLRGRADLVLPPGEHGTGAAALVRAEGGDLFGYGAREAIVRAVAGAAADQAPFGAPVTAEELLDALRRAGLEGHVVGPDEVRSPAARADLAAVVAFAHGWSPVEAPLGAPAGTPLGTPLGTPARDVAGADLRLRPGSP